MDNFVKIYFSLLDFFPPRVLFPIQNEYLGKGQEHFYISAHVIHMRSAHS